MKSLNSNSTPTLSSTRMKRQTSHAFFLKNMLPCYSCLLLLLLSCLPNQSFAFVPLPPQSSPSFVYYLRSGKSRKSSTASTQLLFPSSSASSEEEQHHHYSYHFSSFSSSFAERMQKGLQDERRIRATTSSTSLSSTSSLSLSSTLSSPSPSLSARVACSLGRLSSSINVMEVLGLSLIAAKTASTTVAGVAATVARAAAATSTALTKRTPSPATSFWMSSSSTSSTWRQALIVAALLLPSTTSSFAGSMTCSVATWLTGALQVSFVWYMQQLASHPMITKSITAALIGVTGDFMAQGIEHMLLAKKSSPSLSSLSSLSSSTQSPPRYDARRGLSILPHSLLISGPLMHLAYDLFETFLPVATAGSSTRGLAAISHVLADSIFLDSIFVATTFVVTGIAEGYNRRQLTKQLKKDYIPTLVASWVTSLGLLPLEFLCFCYLPVSLRVMAVNVIDVIWDTVISFMAHRSRGHQQHQEQEQHEHDHQSATNTNSNNSNNYGTTFPTVTAATTATSWISPVLS